MIATDGQPIAIIAECDGVGVGDGKRSTNSPVLDTPEPNHPSLGEADTSQFPDGWKLSSRCFPGDDGHPLRRSNRVVSGPG